MASPKPSYFPTLGVRASTYKFCQDIFQYIAPSFGKPRHKISRKAKDQKSLWICVIRDSFVSVFVSVIKFYTRNYIESNSDYNDPWIFILFILIITGIIYFFNYVFSSVR